MTKPQTSPASTRTTARAVAQSPSLAERQLPMYFKTAFRADPMERVRWVKSGMPARFVEEMARDMSVSKEALAGTLGLARATIDRKARQDKPLSSDESSRVLGLARLVGQVQAMVEESGDPAGFNAGEWVARWLDRPLPALDGRRPAELMDTAEGQSLVSTIVARMQSGAVS
jgi:putative toxin-antitoxin system antitoxin component (TIGR02293 family)